MAMYTRCGSCGKKIPIGTRCECRKERYKRYDKAIRNNKQNKTYTQFYNSKSWKKMSSNVKSKHNGLCLVCLLEYQLIKFADVVHHIETLRENWDKRLCEDNLIPLCHGCHNRIDHINCPEEEKEQLKQLLKDYKNKYTIG